MKAGATRLTASEAERLWRAWKVEQDAQARDRLVVSYMPLVTYIAQRKARELPAQCDVDDLVSCGLIALVETVDRFDPAQGATFEQYAWTRVSGAIMDELRRQDWAPRPVRRLGRRIERTQEKLYIRTGVTPTAEQVAEELEIAAESVLATLDDLERASLVSLNAPARGADEGLPIEVGDTIEATPGEYDPVRATLAHERVATLREAIAGLGEPERRVLALIHVHELSGAEVGRMLGVTESRVSQILSGVRTKLRARLDRYETGDLLAS